MNLQVRSKLIELQEPIRRVGRHETHCRAVRRHDNVEYDGKNRSAGAQRDRTFAIQRNAGPQYHRRISRIIVKMWESRMSTSVSSRT